MSRLLKFEESDSSNLSTRKRRNKTMKVSEFANSYKTLNSADLKNSLVTQHIKRTYAPIAEKNALLKKLADDSVMVYIRSSNSIRSRL